MQGHIDKLSKKIGFDITDKPIGAIQWDFLCSIGEAEESFLEQYIKGPESLFIYNTSQCSLECEDCAAKAHGGEKDLDYNILVDLLKDQTARRLKYVILDGDALKYEKWDELLEFMVSNKIPYSINSYSAITYEQLKSLKGSVCKIQFKIDDMGTDDYLQTISQNLNLCRELGIYTAVIFTVNSSNYDRIEDMIKYCKEYNVKQFSFSRLPFCPFKDIKNSFIEKSEYLKLSKFLLNLRENDTELHITSNDAIWKGCGACALTASIMPNGDVLPCAYLPAKAGNIYDDGFIDIWKGEIFSNIRESKLEGKCGSCKYKFYCKGCRAVALEENGGYLSEDGGCWL